MNRREMLTGVAVASATVALSAPTIAKSLSASRTAWDEVVAHWSAVQGTRPFVMDTWCNKQASVTQGENRALPAPAQ